jgi:hypothetical protein
VKENGSFSFIPWVQLHLLLLVTRFLGLGLPGAKLATTSWFLRTFGDLGSLKQNCHR